MNKILFVISWIIIFCAFVFQGNSFDKLKPKIEDIGRIKYQVKLIKALETPNDYHDKVVTIQSIHATNINNAKVIFIAGRMFVEREGQ